MQSQIEQTMEAVLGMSFRPSRTHSDLLPRCNYQREGKPGPKHTQSTSLLQHGHRTNSQAASLRTGYGCHHRVGAFTDIHLQTRRGHRSPCETISSKNPPPAFKAAQTERRYSFSKGADLGLTITPAFCIHKTSNTPTST